MSDRHSRAVKNIRRGEKGGAGGGGKKKGK